MAEPIDFSKTQRVVLLIDLHPLLTFQNPNPCVTAILPAAKRLLSFAPLSNSLFAFKLFFSSLSPLRSASAVHRLLPNPALNSLSFSSCSQTLTSLSAILGSLPVYQIATELSSEKPRASHTASSLLQLVHDYAWESEFENFRGKGVGDFQITRSNLVLLFSPVGGSINPLSEYLGVDANSQVFDDLDAFLVKFCNAFGAVNDAFASRGIHFGWIDVKCDLEGNERGIELRSVAEGIRKLGWGFCSTDCIVLGSAFIPFGLIYPNIGVPFNFLSFRGSSKTSLVQLSLGILDVNGKPLECNCCDLELLRDLQTEEFDQSGTLLNCFLDGTTKLCIKAVQRYIEGEKIERCSSDIILIRDCLGESKKHKKKPRSDFYADKVLDTLSRETNELSTRSAMPIWLILLSFLYRENYWALVSLSNSNGEEVIGILKPFTSHLALLTIVKNDCLGVHDCSVSNLVNIYNGIHACTVETSDPNGCIGSQTDTSTSGNCESLGYGKKKENRKHSIQDLTWSSFCKAALGCSEFDLATVYLARNLDQKRLKFLKCWMKQVIKFSQNHTRMLHKSNKNTIEPSISSNFSSEPSGEQEGAVFVSCPETSEAFFNSLSRRIQHGLQSGMDLWTLAERLVKSSIYWMRQTSVKNGYVEVRNPVPNVDDSCKELSATLIKLLVRDPKEMKDLSKGHDPPNKPSDPNPKSEIIVREYELQVLLRMEILRSDVSESIEEPIRQKLLKQICSLLEVIQYLVHGGIHGNVSLYEYVERTIKIRYHETLEDIVNNIYKRMDLLPFGDEDETQALLFNSEDSSQSWRDVKEIPEKAEMLDINQPVSTEAEPCRQVENENESPEGFRKKEHARRLSEAQERRERARKFVSFSSRMPDLQRVWAPKQPKAVKERSDSLQKDSKRRDRQKTRYSVVYETPMTGKKRPYTREGSEWNDDHKDPGNCSHSVSKAVFQDS